MNNYCTSCGNKLIPGDLFCQSCGVKVENNITNIQQPQVIYVQNNSGSSSVRTFLFITIILSIIACFLPIISITVLGYSISVNYVINAGKLADGVFVIGAQFLALILLACKTKIPVIIMQLIALSLWGIAAVRLLSGYSDLLSESSYFSYSIYNFLGIGFYLLTISLILSLILSCALPKRK